MLQITYTYRWYCVPLFIALVLLPLSLQQLHQYEQSAHLTEQSHCESEANQFHLHDTEHYGAHHCTLCHFVYQTTPLADAICIGGHIEVLPNDDSFSAQQLATALLAHFPPGRAPPTSL